MRVLLTGASGSVGHHVIPQLLENNHEVTVIELKNKKNKKRLDMYKDKINIIWGSITDKELINNIIVDKDIVIHLAGVIPPYADKHPDITDSVNYEGTKNIVDAIKNSNCFLFFASSISVYGDRVDNCNINVSDPLDISEGDYYAFVKKKTEEMIRNSNINYTIFRLTAIMDIPKIDPLMFHMPLDTKLEICSAKDTARAFVNGINYINVLNKNTYNLGGGEDCRTIYKEFLKRCFSIYGLNYRYLDESSFANQNFHCGYYQDGDILNNIIHFRNDTLDSYYEYLSNNTSKIKKILTYILSPIILYRLNNKSEPKMALKKNEKGLIKRFFK